MLLLVNDLTDAIWDTLSNRLVVIKFECKNLCLKSTLLLYIQIPLSPRFFKNCFICFSYLKTINLLNYANIVTFTKISQVIIKYFSKFIVFVHSNFLWNVYFYKLHKCLIIHRCFRFFDCSSFSFSKMLRKSLCSFLIIKS